MVRPFFHPSYGQSVRPSDRASLLNPTVIFDLSMDSSMISYDDVHSDSNVDDIVDNDGLSLKGGFKSVGAVKIEY